MTQRYWWTGAVLTVGLMLLCACGDSTTTTPTATGNAANVATSTPAPTATPTATPTAAPAGPAFAVQTTLTGTDVVNGGFTVPAPGGCVAPMDLTGLVGAKRVDLHILAMVASPGKAQNLSPGDITVSVDSDVWAVGSAANSPKPSSGTLHINADASGAVAFQNLYLSSSSGSTSLESGQFSWSCH
jgi:hypothetical protein